MDLRTPPAWSLDMDGEYPFRSWLADAVMWSMATQVDETRKAPALVLALGGIAREIAREVPMNILQDGAQVDLGDGVGMQQLSGFAYLLHVLARRFAPLPEESNMRAPRGLVRVPSTSQRADRRDARAMGTCTAASANAVGHRHAKFAGELDALVSVTHPDGVLGTGTQPFQRSIAVEPSIIDAVH